MAEPEPPGVQQLSGRTQGARRATPFTATAVHFVAHHGMADVGEMNPDLVGAPRFEPQLDQRHAG
jgi:hypothetical protein